MINHFDLPEGWKYQKLSARDRFAYRDCIVIYHPEYCTVTINLALRLFAIGKKQPCTRCIGIAEYKGKGWKDGLLEDAIAEAMK